MSTASNYSSPDSIYSVVFNLGKHFQRVEKSDLIINTSCEHMRPMKELNLNTKAYFAYQSNNMLSIEGHINCVYDSDDFKKQLPDNTKVMIEDEIKDDRGTRFLLIGKYE